MEWLEIAWETLREFVPLLATLAGLAVTLVATDRILLRRADASPNHRFVSQLVMLGLTGIGIVVLVLALPVDTDTRGQLLSLLGLVLTAMIALSSTTFVANAMGGLMLRALDNFRPGDFVEVAGQFGRVTERGLFHTEIQSEESDLTTVPNLVLVTTPVRVIRESGTIVSTTLSLGYELSHSRIEPLLQQAASQSGLSDPYVQVLELQDHSVVYRVAGFLRNVKQVLSARSQLRKSVLDTLHGAGIEIVSPSFMNQRRVDDTRFVPQPSAPGPGTTAAKSTVEDRVFDKADRAERIEDLRKELAALEAEQTELVKTAGKGEEPDQRRNAERTSELERKIGSLRAQVDALVAMDAD